jgi:DNA-binding NtrC family response regulator
VKQSGGHVWVYSEPGHGAAFKVYFPRVDEPADAVAAPTKSIESLYGSENILVVEDDEAVRNVSRLALEKYGYTVLEAERGTQALEAFGPLATAIDLVVTDVIMAGMSGPGLVVRLQKVDPDVKVLYVSGYTEEATIHHGVLTEGIAFLQKPFTPDGLVRKVRQLLDQN